MIEKFQRQLQIGSWALVAVLVLASVWFLKSLDQRASGMQETIAVSGVGTVLAKPDIAVANLAITTEAPTATAAQDQANKKSVSVIEYLKKQNIEETDIKTSGYNIYPQYDYTNGRSQIRGYQVTQSLTVKIRNLDNANTILDGVVDAGVNQVNDFRFEVDEPDQLQAEAREKAIADARVKATELRHQLGVRLGKIVSFSEGVVGGPIFYAKDAVGMGGGGAVPAPSLPQGENEVTVNVTIVYQIK